MAYITVSKGTRGTPFIRISIDKFISRSEKCILVPLKLPTPPDRCLWYFCVYPNGNNKNDLGYISVYLCCKLTVFAEIPVYCSVALLNKDGNQVNTCNFKYHFYRKEELKCPDKILENSEEGIGRFISRNSLIVSQESLMPNGKLIFHVEIKMTLLVNTPSFIPNGKVSQKKSKQSEICTLSDILLSVNDGMFHCHKAVLGQKSEELYKLLTANGVKQEQIFMSDLDAFHLQDMLHFIYSGKKPPQIKDSAYVLLPLAIKYGLKVLKNICAKELASSISGANALDYLIISERYNCPELREKAIAFIVDNMSFLWKGKRWTELEVNHPDAVKEIYKSFSGEKFKHQYEIIV